MKHPAPASSASAGELPPGIFRFELDFSGELRCIPMSVRLKLDAVGVKLSLKQWNRIPEGGRRQLLEGLAGTEAQGGRYRELLVALIGAHTGTPVEYSDVDPSPPWANPHVVPQRILEWASGVGVPPPSTAQWAALQPLQRFALFKLTRPGHKNENFLPAMREFSVVP